MVLGWVHGITLGRERVLSGVDDTFIFESLLLIHPTMLRGHCWSHGLVTDTSIIAAPVTAVEPTSTLCSQPRVNARQDTSEA